jgi:hypothetical protein
MNEKTRAMTKVAALAILVLGALALAVSRIRAGLATGEEGAAVWFYDQSEKQLYPVPRETIPPHVGIGGPSGDGVRAAVVACPCEQDDSRKRRIAYLETYTPELQRMLKDACAARLAGRPCSGPVPARDSEYFQINTLVRRADEDIWHTSASPEGQAIMTEWRRCRCADGQPPAVCVP